MTKPVDITDPVVAKAYAHPLRIEILGLLENRVASPAQLAAELGAALSTTSYHVRQLAAMKLIKLVKRRLKRGAVEHYYTAAVRPASTANGWGRVPGIVKRMLIGGKIAQVGEEVATAAESGGFDREDIHFSRTRLRLRPEDWRLASQILDRALTELDALDDRGDDADAEVLEATTVMMLFETRVPFEQEGDAGAATDDLEDLEVATKD